MSACAAEGAEQPAEPSPWDDDVAATRFANTPVAAARNVLVASVVVRPDGAERLLGLTYGAADDPSDLVAAVRVTPAGVLEVRDGEVFRADATLAADGAQVEVRLIADLASRTYSVIASRGEESVELAHRYQFHREVDQLDNFASTGTFADLTSEAPSVLFRRPGMHAIVPLAGDSALVSDGSSTTLIGARGDTLATRVGGGELAVDASGNVYLARVAGTTLTVEALTAALGPRWSRTYEAPAEARVGAVLVTPIGDITIVLGAESFAIRQLAPDGTTRWTRTLTADAVAPNAVGIVVARTTAASVTVEQLDCEGRSVWTRTWPNDVTVDQIATSATGQIVLGGMFFGTIDFGGGAIEAHPDVGNGYKNAYVVALTPAGSPVFSQRIGEQFVTAIASNGTRTIVAAHHAMGPEAVAPVMTTRYTFDQSGTVVDWREGLSGFGWFGKTYRLALGDSGRVYWSYGPSWPDNVTEWPQLVAY